MWKDFITKLNTSYTIGFDEPVSENELIEMEKALNIKLPESLRSLLYETNGFEDGTLMSAKDIEKINLFLRNSSDLTESFMPLDCFLFFGDAGNGDYFGFPIINGEIWKEDVYGWNHEDDSRTWVASSLKNFLKVWLSGELSI